MSYRAFKRLLGETSLERKCRFLLGGILLILMTASFWFYARQNEKIVFDQLPTTCRLLVNHIVAHQIATRCRDNPNDLPSLEKQKEISAVASDLLNPSPMGAFTRAAIAQTVQPKTAHEQRTVAMAEFRQLLEDDWPEALKKSSFSFLKAQTTRSELKPENDFDYEQLEKFMKSPRHKDHGELLSSEHYHYYAPVRSTQSCLGCHQQRNPELKQGGLIAMIKITINAESIQSGVNKNRAYLIGTALATALLIMGGAWLIVRYVIVKPVKHLKEVSDAISAGELNVRSEIQTGDEFEDLSHAFNRMLRNLVSMQDRLRKVNSDLDRKVDELAQANLALYESNQLKSDFLATMSHELRTPLNSILGFSDVLASNPDLPEKQKRWVSNIKSSGERLLNLINEILDLAKIEAGKMEVKLSNFSCYDVCEGLLAMFNPLAEQKNIHLRAQFDENVPVLRQDVGKVQQILSNLLSNAIKFTPEGGRVTLRAQVVATALPPQLWSGPNATHSLLNRTELSDPPTPRARDILLIVEDTGVGITPEEQELVFEKFRQGANPLTRDHQGSGLGLSITRELTKLLGGEISLQSELGRGSTFTVRLPLQLSTEPRLEFDLAKESVDLSKAQRIDSRLYAMPNNPESR